MTRAQLKTIISYWVDDLNKGYFTDDQLNAFINRAQYEVQKLLKMADDSYYRKCQVTTTVLYQQEYVLPDDFLDVVKLEVVLNQTQSSEDASVVLPCTPQQANLVGLQVGTPVSYYIKKNNLVLFPKPDNAYTLRLNYLYRVTELTNDNQQVDAPEQYHEFVAVMAALDCFIKDGRDISALLNKKNDYMEMMKRDAQDVTLDSPRMVVETGNGYGTFF